MKLIIGLGNPGKEYERTRHNVGFLVVDRLVQELGIGSFELRKELKSSVISYQSLVILARPQTMMNDSGIVVKFLSTYYQIPTANIYVIHDDLDLPLGSYKIQKGIGPKLHYGIQSIEKELGNKDFWRVRVGIDNRVSGAKIQGEKYVLQNFEEDEKKLISEIIAKVIQDIERILLASGI